MCPIRNAEGIICKIPSTIPSPAYANEITTIFLPAITFAFVLATGVSNFDLF